MGRKELLLTLKWNKQFSSSCVKAGFHNYHLIVASNRTGFETKRPTWSPGHLPAPRTEPSEIISFHSMENLLLTPNIHTLPSSLQDGEWDAVIIITPIPVVAWRNLKLRHKFMPFPHVGNWSSPSYWQEMFWLRQVLSIHCWWNSLLSTVPWQQLEKMWLCQLISWTHFPLLAEIRKAGIRLSGIYFRIWLRTKMAWKMLVEKWLSPVFLTTADNDPWSVTSDFSEAFGKLLVKFSWVSRMLDLIPYPLIGGASLPALVQLHCPGLTISRGERALFTRSRDLDSDSIHLFSKNLWRTTMH